MITRHLGDGGPVATIEGAPPPLHVYDADCERANWYPAPRPAMAVSQPDGPGFIFKIPTSTFGDDPTDPSQQTKPRIACTGMIGRLHEQRGGGK